MERGDASPHHGLIGIHHFQIEDTIDADGHLGSSPKVASSVASSVALRKSCEFFYGIPSGYVKIAIENGHL